MNGRLYDPVLHRFLQPDNYIQDPFNTQNFNRYGYVLNNPLLYTDPSGELWWLVPAILLFTTDTGYEIQKYISPVAFKIDIKIGTHQTGLGFDASFGMPKLSPYSYRADVGATYFWKTYGDYKGWETRTGHEQSILGLYHWGKTNYKSGEFTQTTGFKSFGIPHIVSLTASNDLWGDEGDRFRTSYQRIDFFGLSIGNAIFTGDPGLIDDDEHRKTIPESRSTAGKMYVKSPYGDPDRYRNGILYAGIGPLQIGWDSEGIRHFFQNIIGHNLISKGSPWFRIVDRPSRPYVQIGGGWR